MMLTVAYFAHTRNYGRDVAVLGAQARKGDAGGRRSVALRAARRLGCCASFGMPGGWSVIVAFALLLVLDKVFDFSAVMALLTPVMLIGGMTLGVFTPTEGAIAASLWALFLGLVWYRTLDLAAADQGHDGHDRDHRGGPLHRRGGSIFGWLLTVTHVTDALAAWVLAFTHSPWVFLLLANVLCSSSAASSSRPRRSPSSCRS